ncbi:tryptophan--tRNA ligase [Candidatus Falkowbacteria bacterium RIFOXYB2_FULL_34_18]|uniref:Tryptophan--tRNA ligase n=1 Tax=Candidatus Falkowbacteria bacterium RIFOXYD2_FULL_34_120 TaxID=1798007 RepID=A0A1F5TNB1_9BACT|nr:MAG: tryptophan--tRNA ligase [Candidatus Falkowbacteria bacterium RIFOXYB2_FULL_34_18]OGF28778.1 MAG: tryptophan--tRNA ligase [Candidatus Falkowbacteria bacterium RIFOXYC12_FULL_34_55]OGF35695.1 MAG: tryptophan--tRNA ligase [Candidatus Falkowbacteria bacterium RIFOXYC2_FULL_34_220]OGF38410.1 MAG: tryptophan--tRNA ligase [Candidatus Falkowbacteria bacterium RIFOXYD12_FULL_34_57]OGF40465.1 MAG: tryptophan--tRNA ligase [Candidatus Falkowbacteria bacterium RIFOXYD2_FULL_34_120]
MEKNNKKRIFSGVQPSGDLHIGNYLGAISQWVNMQNKYECIFCVVDYHAITVKQDPEILRKKIIEIAKIYIASGIDPQKSVIFQQSTITAHTEFAWILNCIVARMSDLNKMTQFKDKSGNHQENVGIGLYDYPVLMASDILLYNTDVVPVGDDQLQHVELTRTLARRFNERFGDTLQLPKAEIRKTGARIMGLDDPTKKMSKSAASDLNYIALTDNPDKAAKKIMRAVTDTGSEIKYDLEKKPGISNLLTIYSLLVKKEIKELEKEYQNKMYGEFKKNLAEVVKSFLIDFQKKYNAISDKEVEQIMAQGTKKIKPIADNTLDRVKMKIGVL